jgi:hypothetical protein
VEVTGVSVLPKNVKPFSCLDEFAVAKKHMGGFSDHTSVSSPPFSTGKPEVDS